MMRAQTLKPPTHYMRGIIVGLAALLTMACRDSSLAPSHSRTLALGRPVLSLFVGSVTFTYDPGSDLSAPIGQHRLVIPSRGVCDPAVSSYGIGTWDDACRPLTQPIAITATAYVDATGHPFVQFQPALRFVPGRVTTLFLYDKHASADVFAKIVYCPDTGACIDESLTDPSLLTYKAGKDTYYRRIKHFSGYNVAALEDDVLPIEY